MARTEPVLAENIALDDYSHLDKTDPYAVHPSFYEVTVFASMYHSSCGVMFRPLDRIKDYVR
jgi:hypothetical protein